MSNSKTQQNILWVMTGSIAAFKAVAAISKLKGLGYNVRVVLTPSAKEFIGPATIEGITGEPALSDLFASGRAMDHIELDRWADAIVICPATGQHLNQMAAGFGEPLTSSLYLAHDFKKPILVFPAMNHAMWAHPTTRRSLEILKNDGVQIVEPASGALACGEIGSGRLIEPDMIVAEVERAFKDQSAHTALVGGSKSRVLVIYGGTEEKLDAVRVITNLSTGNTGAALCERLAQKGVMVTALRAQRAPKVSVVKVDRTFTSAASLKHSLLSLIKNDEFDMVIFCAAISDYAVSAIEAEGQLLNSSEKISSSSEELVLRLSRQPKVITEIAPLLPTTTDLISFKLTSNASEDQVHEAVEKLFEISNLGAVVHNDTRDMKANQHPFTLFSADGSIQQISDVNDLAEALWERLPVPLDDSLSSVTNSAIRGPVHYNSGQEQELL